MTDQEINRAIAEALTAQGFDEGLAWDNRFICDEGHVQGFRLDDGTCAEDAGGEPCGLPTRHVRHAHDFTDPHYLWPAVRAYCSHRNKTENRTFSLKLVYFLIGTETEGGFAAILPEYEIDNGHNLFDLSISGADDMDALRNALHAALGVGE